MSTVTPASMLWVGPGIWYYIQCGVRPSHAHVLAKRWYNISRNIMITVHKRHIRAQRHDLYKTRGTGTPIMQSNNLQLNHIQGSKNYANYGCKRRGV